MRACSSSRASYHPLMVADSTLWAFCAPIFLLPSSPHRKGTAQINLSDAVGVLFDTRKKEYQNSSSTMIMSRQILSEKREPLPAGSRGGAQQHKACLSRERTAM